VMESRGKSPHANRAVVYSPAVLPRSARRQRLSRWRDRRRGRGACGVREEKNDETLRALLPRGA